MNIMDAALVLELIAQSNRNEVWCGESYLQKVSYIAKTALKLPLSMPFLLYKRGPYSFELKALLLELRANRLVMLAPEGHYGPSYAVVDNVVMKQLRTHVGEHSEVVEPLVKCLSRKSIAELEAFSTAVMFWASQHEDADKYADELNELFPSISRPDAAATVEEARAFLKKDQVHA